MKVILADDGRPLAVDGVVDAYLNGLGRAGLRALVLDLAATSAGAQRVLRLRASPAGSDVQRELIGQIDRALSQIDLNFYDPYDHYVELSGRGALHPAVRRCGPHRPDRHVRWRRLCDQLRDDRAPLPGGRHDHRRELRASAPRGGGLGRGDHRQTRGDRRPAHRRGPRRRLAGRPGAAVEQAKELGITDIDILGATEYYKTDRGAKPNGLNQTLRSHLGPGYGWDAFHLAEELLTQPLLVIVGSEPGGFGAYRDGHEIVRRARSEKKELVVLDGWSHYDLYDKPEPVSEAMAKLVPFFTENL